MSQLFGIFKILETPTLKQLSSKMEMDIVAIYLFKDSNN
jgi:hypothetical protein